MKRNNKQNARLHGLVRELNISKEMKADLVFKYTEGKYTSSAEMTYQQCQILITDLQKQVSKETKRLNNMRRKIIALGKEMQWKLEDIKQFCLTKGKHKKKDFNDYNGVELKDLINQFEQIVKHEKAKRSNSPAKE